MSGDNKHIATDVLRVDQRKPIGNTTYILYESGIAPFREEVEFRSPPIPITYKVEVPVYVDRDGDGFKETPLTRRDAEGNEVPVTREEERIYNITIKAKWPNLVASEGGHVRQLIEVGEQTEETLPLADMDSVVAKEFQLRWPGIRNRIILATALKTTGHIVAIKKLGWLGGFGGSIYTDLMKGTDSRTWRTLPSNFQVCRIATPADRKIKLGRSDNAASVEIELIDGNVNVVYVKQSAPGTVPYVNQFKLK